jgi:hypothetical protein
MIKTCENIFGQRHPSHYFRAVQTISFTAGGKPIPVYASVMMGKIKLVILILQYTNRLKRYIIPLF